MIFVRFKEVAWQELLDIPLILADYGIKFYETQFAWIIGFEDEKDIFPILLKYDSEVIIPGTIDSEVLDWLETKE